MQRSKLVAILKHLEETELELLRQFLRSPYFFKGKIEEEALRLFEYIVAAAPDFKAESLDKSKAWAQIFSEQVFNKSKLDQLMTRLLKNVNRFLAYHFDDLEGDAVRQQLALSRFFRERRLGKQFDRNIEGLRKKQRSIPRRHRAFYFQQFLIERELSDYESLYNTRKADLNLPATLRSLDLYYLITKLEYVCMLLAQHKYHHALDLKDSLEIIELMTPMIQQKHYQEVPALKLYYQAFCMLQSEGDDDAFQSLCYLLREYEDQIPLAQLKDLQTLSRNYCIRQYNRGHRDYLNEAFKLYQQHLDQGYLHYEEGLVAGTIRNIVSIGLKLHQYDWVLQFLTDYKDKIVGTNYPDEVYHFNLATYYFALGDYDAALKYLADTYEDTYYKIAAKRMELKIYYEKKSVLLDPKINAFKVYIFRTSKRLLTELQREGNNNFIDFLKRICSPKTSWDSGRIQKLIKNLEQSRIVTDKEWLQNKLLELQ
ncbi:MAG: hypothetical protein AAGG75_17265 [Bacteroidota bacterium]